MRSKALLVLLVALSSLPSGPASRAQTLDADVQDVLDGQTVVRVTLDGKPVGLADGLTWTLLSGRAELSEDRFTKLSLFRPQGDVPLVAQPAITIPLEGEPRRVLGAPTTIGLAASQIPPEEQRFFAAGGGLCDANPNHAACFALSVDVRSMIDSTVIPLSTTERRVRYLRGEYYAFDPKVGLMRITFNPAYRSETRLVSLNPGSGGSFFPARAESDFYFIIEILATGVRIFNPKPMQFLAPTTNWPVFGTPLEHQKPVAFHFLDTPEEECLSIENQYMSLYSQGELEVQVLRFAITDGGQLSSRWRISNRSNLAATLAVFPVGNLAPQLFTREIGPAGSSGGAIEVSLSGQVQPSALTQFVALSALSQSGPRLTGTHRVEFRFPQTSAAAVPVISRLGAVVLLLLLLSAGVLVLMRRRRAG